MTPEQQERQAILAKMTNWQSTQAMKACEGNIVKMKLEDLKFFAALQKTQAN